MAVSVRDPRSRAARTSRLGQVSRSITQRSDRTCGTRGGVRWDLRRRGARQCAPGLLPPAHRAVLHARSLRTELFCERGPCAPSRSVSAFPAELMCPCRPGRPSRCCPCRPGTPSRSGRVSRVAWPSRLCSAAGLRAAQRPANRGTLYAHVVQTERLCTGPPVQSLSVCGGVCGWVQAPLGQPRPLSWRGPAPVTGLG